MPLSRAGWGKHSGVFVNGPIKIPGKVERCRVAEPCNYWRDHCVQLHPIKTLSLVRVFIVWLLCALSKVYTYIRRFSGQKAMVQTDALKSNIVRQYQTSPDDNTDASSFL